ncbi:hypothetical protein DF268_07085 [Streptomyces sp. V2]|uniref:ubiquinol-cytochrome c reductase iron-sulfur subunit N-terminal domain-containing protein n=1 Tax=Streptomyces TaxID=1883 RepID=UPI000D14F56B|nr:hypothetical protein DF268_07085 [Streptomyces sp. V2]
MHDGKTPGRRRFLGLAAAGAGAVGLAGLGSRRSPRTRHRYGRTAPRTRSTAASGPSRTC